MKSKDKKNEKQKRNGEEKKKKDRKKNKDFNRGINKGIYSTNRKLKRKELN
jgi:hypothetical protein